MPEPIYIYIEEVKYDRLLHKLRDNNSNYTYIYWKYFLPNTNQGCSGCDNLCETCEGLSRVKKRRVFLNRSLFMETKNPKGERCILKRS